jgi:adenylate cyclase
MNESWMLRIYDGERLIYEADLSGAAEIGRQVNEDEKRTGDVTFRPWHYAVKDSWRVVIAPLKDITISRKHIEVMPLGEQRFRVTNRSATQALGLMSKELQPGESSDVTFPAVIWLGGKTIRLLPAEEEESLSSLPMATMAPGANSPMPMMQAIGRIGSESAMGADQLNAWIQAFLGLLHSAAGSEDFYSEAARALVDLVKLDSGRVLMHNNGAGWSERAAHCAPQVKRDAQWKASTRILTSLMREKKTFWHLPATRSDTSTAGIDAVVAAPILDRRGKVIGALYGERRLESIAAIHRPISKLEASLVEVLASGVAAGLARVEQEQAALRARLQMEQFFGQRLAAKLVEHPELLEGRETDVSVLVCDIRGFSRIAEKLGPARTVEWVSDCMGDLTQCVLDHEGVVVDYVGDELMAMWGAPEHQPDHAARACRTALAMVEGLPRLSERWQRVIREPLQLGIGVNSGIAQVGNVGSKIKFKYGPLGNTVNLASRVQGANKHLKTNMLITDATRDGLDPSFQSRRLCQVRVVNIAQPVTLYELVGSASNDWITMRSDYEQALDHFTKGEFRQACRTLGRIILDHPDDGPSITLLSRAVACLVQTPDPFDAVMVLPGK